LETLTSCAHLEAVVDHEIALSNVLEEVYLLPGCTSRKGDPGVLLLAWFVSPLIRPKLGFSDPAGSN
jgi:hypothetical protein